MMALIKEQLTEILSERHQEQYSAIGKLLEKDSFMTSHIKSSYENMDFQDQPTMLRYIASLYR